MAAKKTAKGSKSAFVRKHQDLKPAEVEAKAKEAGLDISAAYVSNVRSADKGGASKKAKGAAKKAAAAPAKAVAKAKGKPGPKAGGGPSKSDFIRSHPDLSASDLVAAAKAEGLSLAAGLVYSVRAAGKANKKGAAKTGRQSKGSPVPSRSVSTSGPSGDHIKEILRLAIAAAGIDGAARLLDEARKRIDLIV